MTWYSDWKLQFFDRIQSEYINASKYGDDRCSFILDDFFYPYGRQNDTQICSIIEEKLTTELGINVRASLPPINPLKTGHRKMTLELEWKRS